MNKIITRTALATCSLILLFAATGNAQLTVIHYWDFNLTPPLWTNGGDSLGTAFAYANLYAVSDANPFTAEHEFSGSTDSLDKTGMLWAPYTLLPSTPGYILYTRPTAKQGSATKRDSDLDNASGKSPYCYINDLHILGNDSNGTAGDNDYIRSRNPDENCYMYLYLPTTGFSNIILNYGISASSSSGANYNIFQYSTNGGSTWKNLTTAMDTFNISGVYRPDTLQVLNPTTVASNWYPVQINFSSDPTVNNNANFVLRWEFEGPSSTGTSGNDRYDNISLSGESLCPTFNSQPANIISCASGSASFSVTVVGGTLPYTYQWEVNSGTGFSAISNGGVYSGATTGTLTISNTSGLNTYQYECTVNDPSCSTITSNAATLTVDPALNVSITSYTNVTCSGNGSAVASPSGGTSPYTYSWSNNQTNATATNLAAGNYTITVKDADGCSATNSVTIGLNGVAVTISSHTNADCSGGSATASASGGTSPYTYSWSNSQTSSTATALSAGNYTVTVKDNTGCTGTASVSILSIALRDSINASGQYEILDYWDFNNTPPSGGGGGDSLGTSAYPLPAQYSLVPGASPMIYYTRPETTQSGAAKRDSILDNVSPESGSSPTPACFYNDLHILGNDSGGTVTGNLAVRSRNPDVNSYMVLVMPTTGYENLVLNYAISASSSKGAFYNIFSYSTNGGSTWKNLTTAMDTFNISGVRRPDTLQFINPTTSASNWYPVQINFSSDPSVNNNPNFIVRWEFEGSGSTGTSGNDRYDNISLSGNLATETCNGDDNYTATAEVKYGATPYTYSWSPSGGSSATASNLSAGTYTLTVKDANGCSATSSLTINNPAALTATVTTIENVLCYGYYTGVAETSESGGTPPYNYTWSPSGGTLANIIGVAAGTYTLTVTDFFGCSTSTTATISQPPSLTFNTSVTNVNCYGNNTGSITATPSGGTAPYTYSWSSNQITSTISNLSAGTYTITLTDSYGCSGSAAVTITQPAAPLSVSIPPGTKVSCYGGTASVPTNTLGGTSPYTYSWNPGGGNSSSENLSAGSYTVSVTDNNGCTASFSITLTQPAYAIRDSVSLSGGANEVIHYWDFNNIPPSGGGGVKSVPSDSLATIANPLAAQYTLIRGGSPRIVYQRPSAIQTFPLVCTKRDSIVDNLSPTMYFGWYNDLPLLGNDTGGTQAGNLAIRARNPSENAYMVLYLPTSGYSNILLNFAYSASSTSGANYNIFSYSTNGGTSWNNVTTAMDTFNISSRRTGDTLQVNNPATDLQPDGHFDAAQINFSSDPTVNNNPNFIVRWQFEGAACNGTSGNDRYDNISLSGNIMNESCNGDNQITATAGVKYGTTPYTYSWSPGVGSSATASNLTAGTYTLSIQDVNGCSASSTFTITQPSSLSVSGSATGSPTCNGGDNGSGSASASGGTSPYNYSWSPGGEKSSSATGLSAGTYTVYATDAFGCTATATATITQPVALIASITSYTNAACSLNGSATAGITNGTAPYTYSWSNGQETSTASSLVLGTYTVTVTDTHGCTASTTVAIGESANTVSVGIVSQTNVECNAYGTATASASGGTSPYTYSWTDGEKTATATALSAGTYTITVTDNLGCNAFNSVTILQAGQLRDSINASGQYSVIHYWDFNQTVPYHGGAGDSLGTAFAYANSYASLHAFSGSTDSLNKTGTLYANYSLLPSLDPRIIYTRPQGTQTGASKRDSITDNGNGGAVGAAGNELISLSGNDTAGGEGNNYIRVRQPSINSYLDLILPTNGFSNIVLNYANESSGSGAYYNIIQYSTNGGSSWKNVTTPMDTFNISGRRTGDTLISNAGNWRPIAINFSSDPTVDNNPNFMVRWTFSGANVLLTNGNDRYDNISLSGNLITETCYGGNEVNATAGVKNGTAPYTYSWSNGGTTAAQSNLTAGTYTLTVKDANGCSASSSATVTQPPLLTASIASYNNISCNGSSNGTATATASGGTSPYKYSWSPLGGTQSTASGLSMGTYTVTVNDEVGCSSTAGVTITQPIALTANASVTTNVNCIGNSTGNASTSISGGTSPYTYSWSNGSSTVSTANPTGAILSAGTYTVSITDNSGCTASAMATVTQPANALGINISSVTNITCSAGTGSVTADVATGGTSPYTYSWSGGGENPTNSGLNAGTYTITVTDNTGCTATAVATITQAPTLEISLSSVSNVLCNGDNGSLTANVASGGEPPYTYTWSPSGGTSLTATISAGTYTITVIDGNSCNATASATVTQPTSPLGISIESVSNASSYGGTGSATANAANGGTSPYTYSWSPEGGTNLTTTPVDAGTYTITVTDGHGCTASTSATITQPTVSLGITIASVTNVSCKGSTGDITANAATGGTSPYTYSWAPNGGTGLTTTPLSAGTYTITVTDNKGNTATASATITQTTALSVVPTVTADELCYGESEGSGYVSVSGGNSPYTYSWSNGATTSSISGLLSNKYYITVSDNGGCSTLDSMVINQSNLLAVATADATTEVSCNGGTNGVAKVSVDGGVTPYTYSWSPVGGSTYIAKDLSAGTYSVVLMDKNGCSASSGIVTVTQPAELRDSLASATYPSCSIPTGSATIGVKGGSPPYTFKWSPGVSTSATASGLTVGNYIVQVKDHNGCYNNLTVSITEPPILRDSIVKVSLTNVPCSGAPIGSATVGVKYGTPPYTYAWNPDVSTTAKVSGLSAGTYSVTVTDATTCSASASVIITQSTGAILKITSSVTDDVSCNGGGNGETKVSVTGGATPYTYAWSPNSNSTYINSGLLAGVYMVTVTDHNGCSNTGAALTVTQPAALRDSVSVTDPKCNAGTGSAVVGVKGGTLPYSYTWSPSVSTTASASGLTARSYVVQVKDHHGCYNDLDFSITQPAALHASISSGTCSDNLAAATVNVTGGISPYTYSWTPGNYTNATVSGLSPGTYSITVTDADDCSISINPSINCPGSISPDAPQQANNATGQCCPGMEYIDLYPNPNSGQFTIAGVTKGMIIQVYDYTGREISSLVANNEIMQLNISTQSNGIYLIRIMDTNGNLVSQKKVVKMQ